MADVNSFETGLSIAQYGKKPIPQIIKESADINAQTAAKEILIWIANNVEQFIDNQKRMFKLDLIIDAEETMPEIRKLQNLYRAIPNDPVANIDGDLSVDNYNEVIANLSPEDRELIDNIQACRTHLDTVSNQVFEAMQSDQDLLEALFKRMGWYYELQGINQGELLLNELKGEVDIVKFEYECFPIAVQVTAPKIERMNKDGTITKEGGEVANEYVIPEGFTIWLEIAFRSKSRDMSSLF